MFYEGSWLLTWNFILAESILVIIFSFEAVVISIQELTGKMFIAHLLSKIHTEKSGLWLFLWFLLAMNLRSNTHYHAWWHRKSQTANIPGRSNYNFSMVLCCVVLWRTDLDGISRKLHWKQSEVILMLFQGHHQSKLKIWFYCNKKFRKRPYSLLAFASLLSNRASSVMLKARKDEKVNDNPYDCCQQILILERRFIEFDKTQKFTKH